MYDIEVEQTAQSMKGLHDPVFELVRKRGGSVTEDDVACAPVNDKGFNSKDPEFISVIFDMGLGNVLYRKAKEVYK